jgi:hypothetical protein
LSPFCSGIIKKPHQASFYYPASAHIRKSRRRQANTGNGKGAQLRPCNFLPYFAIKPDGNLSKCRGDACVAPPD